MSSSDIPIEESHYTDNPLELIPPNSIEAEQVVLGSLLCYAKECLHTVLSICDTEDFYRTRHQHIYQAIKDLHAKGEAVDVVSVSEQLKSTGTLNECGGRTYLNDLAVIGVSEFQVGYHAQLIRGFATKRELLFTGYEIIKAAHTIKDSTDAIIHCQDQLMRVAQREVSSTTFATIGEVMEDLMRDIDENILNPREITGLGTGFRDIDRFTRGWQKSDLIIIAARPSMGKTAFMLNTVEQCSVESGKPSLIFSLEMSQKQLASRILSSASRINSQAFTTGFMTPEQQDTIKRTIERIARAPIYLQDATGLTPEKLKMTANQVMMKTGGYLEMIAIDYLQLMTAGGYFKDNNLAVGHISKSLKGVAKELQVPVIALSQLSRAVEMRPDKRPQLSDLRDSGSIEQDADVVGFLYRDEYYNRETEKPGITEFILAKQRNGPVGTIELAWAHSITRFGNLHPDLPPGPPPV